MPFLLLGVTFVTLYLTRSSNAKLPWELWIVTLFTVGLGCLALIKLRPQSFGFSPPNVMLTLGFGGMITGLYADIGKTHIEILESICSISYDFSVWKSLIFHLRMMPFMHFGMVLGGISAIPSLRLLRPECRKLCSMVSQNILCSFWMLIGMTGGAVIFLNILQELGQLRFNTMLGGMFAGMTWGMVVSVSLYRAYFITRDVLYKKNLPTLTKSSI